MVGRTLGHYKILEKLGEGGMGVVYLAEDKELDRKVALKVLPQAMAGSQERLQRFRREAKTLASLNHPNIVTIYSVESVEGFTFLTMELLEGNALSDYIPKKGVDLHQFFDIAIPLADALAAAHDGGVIHRDVKPSNVFVQRSGAVKVVDFGLAKLASAEAKAVDTEVSTDALTAEGRVLGTVGYMSPEQLQGKPLDHRSDIFAVGIVLYQLATGDKPFKGSTSAEIASSILRDLPPPIDALRLEMPHHVARIVNLCLEKNPEDRMQSAKDLRNELSALKRELTSGGTHIPPVLKPTRRWKSRTVWFVAALAMVALSIGLGVELFRPPSPPTFPLRIPMAPPAGLKPSLADTCVRNGKRHYHPALCETGRGSHRQTSVGHSGCTKPDILTGRSVDCILR
jgi:serine/threonine protein kinase